MTCLLFSDSFELNNELVNNGRRGYFGPLYGNKILIVDVSLGGKKSIDGMIKLRYFLGQNIKTFFFFLINDKILELQ